MGYRRSDALEALEKFDYDLDKVSSHVYLVAPGDIC